MLVRIGTRGLLLLALALACSSTESSGESKSNTGGTAPGGTTSSGAGGSTPTGGSTSGGAVGTGGNGGMTATGGSTAMGGSTATGGSTSGGAGGTNAGRGGASGAAGLAGATAGGGSAGQAGGSGAPSGGGGAGGRANGGSGGSEVVLDPTPGNYRQTCDGSLGIAVDAEHFLDGNDEDQGLRLYTRGADANPLQTLDVSSALGLSSSDEADLEDAARIGDRVYIVSSHGRDKDGNLERARYRFFAADLSGTSPNLALTPAGSTSLLLDQMLSAANWATPNTTVIATLAAASNLATEEDEDLAPGANGTSIEALAAFPTATRPKQLLVGFRNPLQDSRAIVVSLLNPDAVLTGATASFGEATLLDLGGLGFRAMSWSPLHAAVLMLAGPKSDGGPFRLLKWAGPPSTTVSLVREITNVPSDATPEALVVYPNTHDVQVLFDQGDHLVTGTACKDASASNRSFTDTIVHVP